MRQVHYNSKGSHTHQFFYISDFITDFVADSMQTSFHLSVPIEGAPSDGRFLEMFSKG